MIGKLLNKILLFLFALLFLLLVISCSKTKTEPKQGITKNDFEKTRKEQLLNLASKHNALFYWDKEFQEADAFELIYTLALQKALIKGGGQPVAFFASLLDIYEKDGKYFGRFSHSKRYEPFIFFELEISKEQANNFSRHGTDKFQWIDDEDHIVVASIDSVKRLKFRINALFTEEYCTEGLSPDDVDINLENSNVFLATGKIIDANYLKDSIETSPN